jgi:transposase-like protein
MMAKKRHTAEQIIAKLREAEVLLAKGGSMSQVCRKLGVTEQTYYRWRKEYGGVRTDQVKRLKELLTLDNAILKEAAYPNF